MKSSVKFVFFILIVTLIAWQSWNCKDDVAGNDLNNIVFPDSNVSYHKQVEPLFLNGCAIPGGCHAGDPPADGLSLETWLDARDKVGVIVPRFPEESRLIWAIEGRNPGKERMPLSRPPLNANQIKGLRRWITEGAQNN
jgi:hypothetical protein